MQFEDAVCASELKCSFETLHIVVTSAKHAPGSLEFTAVCDYCMSVATKVLCNGILDLECWKLSPSRPTYLVASTSSLAITSVLVHIS